MIKSWRELKAKLFGEKKIVSPYVGLTAEAIIERRRKIATLYPTPCVNPAPVPANVGNLVRERRRELERRVQQESDGLGFTTGLLLGSAMGHGYAADDTPAPAPPSFEAGGGSFGGGGASEGWGDSGSSDSSSSGDSGGGDGGGGGGE